MKTHQNLFEVIELFGGGTPKTTKSEYWNGNIPWLSVVDFNTGKKYVYKTEKTITEKGLEESSTQILPSGSIIISARGTVGALAVLKKQMAFNQSCYGICGIDGQSYTDYIYYALKYNLSEFLQQAHGGVFSTITRDTFKNIEIYLPSFTAQRVIAAVLSSLDDKIDLLHRQNATLEAMAEALFIELFINNAGNSEIISITKYINFNPGYSLKKGEAAQFLEMSNLNTNSFHPSEVTQKNFSSGMKFMNKDTLLARITPCLENGKACYVTFLAKNEVGWGSTEYIVMRPIAKLHPLFAYCLAKSEDFRGYAENCLQGSSGRQRVDLHHLQQYQINSVTNEKLEKFNALAEMIEPKLHNNYIQIQTLEKLRDTLLPKLMSGEVRVSLD